MAPARPTRPLARSSSRKEPSGLALPPNPVSIPHVAASSSSPSTENSNTTHATSSSSSPQTLAATTSPRPFTRAVARSLAHTNLPTPPEGPNSAAASSSPTTLTPVSGSPRTRMPASSALQSTAAHAPKLSDDPRVPSPACAQSSRNTPPSPPSKNARASASSRGTTRRFSQTRLQAHPAELDKSMTSSSSSIETPTSTKRARTATDGLLWRGVLSDSELASLRDQFGNDILCPGCTGSWGRSMDEWGNIYIPGAACGFFESRRVLQGWRKRSQTETHRWWESAVASGHERPIKVLNVLEGIEQDQWARYSATYNRMSVAEKQRRCRERRRKRGQQYAQQHVSTSAASALLALAK